MLGAWLALAGRRSPEGLGTLVRVRGLRRRVDVGQAPGPVLACSLWCRGRAIGRRLLSRAAPLRRTSRASGSVGLNVNVGGWRNRRRGRATIGCARAKELETGFDMGVSGVQLGSPLVGVHSISDLVVARLIQCTKIIPNFWDVGIQTNCTRVGVQSIPVLVDLVVQHSNRAPERRVLSVPVDGLLVSLVCLGILLLRHVASTEKIPALCVCVVGWHRLLQVLDSAVLCIVWVVLLMMQPAQLLQNLGVVGGVVKDPLVGGLGAVKVFLLLVDMANLKPNVLLRQRAGRRADNVLEAVETLRELGLLLVYYTESEVDFVGLFKVGLDLHDLRESLLGIVVAAIAVVKDTNSVPKHGILGVAEVHQGLLVCVVCFLKALRHQVAVA
jgi:hypothetical protein